MSELDFRRMAVWWVNQYHISDIELREVLIEEILKMLLDIARFKPRHLRSI